MGTHFGLPIMFLPPSVPIEKEHPMQILERIN